MQVILKQVTVKADRRENFKAKQLSSLNNSDWTQENPEVRIAANSAVTGTRSLPCDEILNLE